MYHFELEIQLYIHTMYNAIVEYIGLTTSGALQHNIQMSINRE